MLPSILWNELLNYINKKSLVKHSPEEDGVVPEGDPEGEGAAIYRETTN